jgi:cyclophilin family peptidyl-prolyl cis-trans isomerase
MCNFYSPHDLCLSICIFLFLTSSGAAFSTRSFRSSEQAYQNNKISHYDWFLQASPLDQESVQTCSDTISRRATIRSLAMAAAITCSSSLSPHATAAEDTGKTEITDRIYLTLKGLGPDPKRIVIGLFGKEAPNSVSMIKQLVSESGLPAPCRPRAERSLQKEQLEANKVYSACKERENTGVYLKFSSIWRVIKDERIDVGAVSGRFVARAYPMWSETKASSLKHDAPGVVSVRRGDDSGFGFVIYPGDGKTNTAALDEDNIVVGKVIDGLDVVKELNEVPIILSSKYNYMGLTGGPKTSNSPDRSCRYGGPMYCNENKPLIKLSITDTGVI